jgi:hypothetical protein
MSVLELVHRESRRLRRAAWLAHVLLPLAATVGLLTAAATYLAAGRWLSAPPFVPLLAWGVAVGAAWGVGRMLGRRLRARSTPAAVAAAIESEQGLRRGAITGLLEVAGSGVFADHASAVMGAALQDTAQRPAPRLRRRLWRAAALAVLAMLQVLVLANTSWARRADGWQALLHPVRAWRGELVAPLRITDRPTRVLRGARVSLGIEAPGRTAVQVRWRATGGAWESAMVAVDAAGLAPAVIPQADADLVVLVSDGRAGRDSVYITVVDRPFVGDVQVTAEYPAYLARAAERIPADAPVRIPAGTRLQLVGSASEPLAAVALEGPGRRITLQPDGARFRGTFTPSVSGAYAWAVAGLAQPIEDIPAPLDIEIIQDSLPRVEILAPVGEHFVTPSSRVTLELLAQDDHALRGVWLRVKRVGSDAAPIETRLSEAREPTWAGTATTAVSTFALQPGDALEVTLLARDAAPGERTAVSAPVVLRVPTTAEAREAAREAAEAAVAQAEAAAAAQAGLAERTATESRTRSDRGTDAQAGGAAGTQPQAGQPQPGQQQPGKPGQPGQQGAAGERQENAPRDPLGYEGAERAREIAEEQRELAQRVEQLEEAARELEDRLRSAGALDSTLARQLQDAQRMLREAMTPEMAEALGRLDQATEQLDGARTRQSLADLAAQQQRLRETLERSTELLRRAALEGQLQTLADQGRELAEEQRAIADSAAAQPPSAERAQRMQQEAADLARSAEQLAQRLEQAQAEPGAQAAAEGAREAQRAAAAMGEMARDASAAQRGAEAMERAADALADARGRQVAQWKAELTDALDRSVQEMVQMAREQDALADRAREEQDAASLRGAQSALQQGVQAAQDRLSDEGRRTTLVTPRSQELMQRAQQRSAQATREAAEGRRGQTEQAMREAADALRQAAAQLTRDRERAANAQSATGMPELLEQMQQLAQQQGGLNSQMQSLLPMAQQRGGAQGMDAAGREQARQLARAQRDVARQLDDISDADPTGRAQEMAREARALAQALDQGAVDPATQARQQQLLRRMLDAGRSLEQDQRDERAKREARAARGTERFTPTGDGRGAPGERFAVPTWEELRGLSAEDRRLVIEYFRRLNAGGPP